MRQVHSAFTGEQKLAPGGRFAIQDEHLPPLFGQSLRRHQTRRPGAHNGHLTR
jgi:hypothetical protein